MKFANKLRVTTTDTDTSALALGAADKGYWTLAQLIAAGGAAVGNAGVSLMVDDGQGNWEVSTYTITSAARLTRTAVTASSNGGAAVTFPAGQKVVTAVVAQTDNIVVSSSAPSNSDGRPDGTIYIQTA